MLRRTQELGILPGIGLARGVLTGGGMTPPSASPGNSSSASRASLSGAEPGELLRRVAAPEDARTLAEELARDFASTAVERDRQGGTAQRERDRLRQSGLLGLSVPVELGGAGASWSEVLEVVRILARADGSLAHLFGFHHLMLATARLFGAPQQWRPLLRETVRQRWFWGNALNPLDARTTLSRDGDGFRIDGAKSFCSGSVDSDMLIVSALRPPETRLAIAAPN